MVADKAVRADCKKHATDKPFVSRTLQLLWVQWEL